MVPLHTLEPCHISKHRKGSCICFRFPCYQSAEYSFPFPHLSGRRAPILLRHFFSKFEDQRQFHHVLLHYSRVNLNCQSNLQGFFHHVNCSNESSRDGPYPVMP